MFKKILTYILITLYLGSSTTGCSTFNILNKGVQKSYGELLYKEYVNEKVQRQQEMGAVNGSIEETNDDTESLGDETGTENAEDETAE